MSASQPVADSHTPSPAGPGPGHNLPVVDLARSLEPETLAVWLDGQFAPQVAVVGELLASYSRFLFATSSGIASEEVAGRAADLALKMRDATAETEKARVRIKAPVLAAQRAIDGAAKAVEDRLVAPLVEIRRRVTVFLQAKEIEVRRLAMIEAARAEAEASRLMQEASRQGSAEVVKQAIEAIGQQQEAEAIVTGSSADVTRVHSKGGSASLAENWTYTVVNIAEVPRAVLTVDDAKVRMMIKAGIRKIEGLLIKNDPKATIR